MSSDSQHGPRHLFTGWDVTQVTRESVYKNINYDSKVRVLLLVLSLILVCGCIFRVIVVVSIAAQQIIPNLVA